MTQHLPYNPGLPYQYITVWNDPKEWLISQYGRVTYLEWCRLDANRMRQNGDSRVQVIKHKRTPEVCVARKNPNPI